MTSDCKTRSKVGLLVEVELVKKRMTQRALAGKIGYSQAYTSEIFTGVKKAPANWVTSVCEELDLSEEKRKQLHVEAARSHGFDIE